MRDRWTTTPLNSQNRNVHSINAHRHEQVLQVIWIAGHGHPRREHNIIKKLVLDCFENVGTHRVTRQVFYL